MKPFLPRSRSSRFSGFTLIELLVVMGIIAILAGVLLPAVNLAIRSAKKAQAANLANQIQTACMGYYTEYSVYPVPTGTTTDYMITDVAGSAGAWKILLCALCGNISPYDGTAVAATTITNTRNEAFLTLKSSDVDVNVAPKNPLATGTEIYFNIAMDGDYSGIMGNGAGTPASSITGASATTGLPNFALSTTTTMNWTGTSTAGVAVWANCNGSTTQTSPSWWVHTY